MSNKPEQDKTEEPSSQRLKKAKEEGNVAKSAELSSVILMIGLMILVVVTGSTMFHEAEMLVVRMHNQADLVLRDSDAMLMFGEHALHAGLAMLFPITIGLVVLAILATVSQTGLIFSTKVLEAKADRISPMNGFKRIFSNKGVFELVKGVSKIGITGIVLYAVLEPEMGHIAQLMIMPISESLRYSGGMVLRLMGSMFSALIILSVLDAGFTRFQHRKELRMTKQEVRDEMKDNEGDPQMKGRRRSLSMTFTRTQRLDHAVLQSDVVLTNPTHYSIALKYDPSVNLAPIVTAMGKDNRAMKIREFAKDHGVHVMPNPALTRALYPVCTVGGTIPTDYFKAVSIVLAHVYREKNKDTYTQANTPSKKS